MKSHSKYISGKVYLSSTTMFTLINLEVYLLDSSFKNYL